MAFTQVTIVQDYNLADGTEPSGTVTFTPTAPMLNGGVVVPQIPAVARLGGGTGTITTTLAANTDPTTTPAGVYYKVVETVNGVTRTFNIQIPHNLGSQITLYSLTQVASPPGISFPSSGTVGALLASSNLSDLASATTARTNLGLHGSAVLDVGTTSGTVAAGDDARLRQIFTPHTLTAVTGVITPDASTGTLFRHTAAANVQLADPTNGTDGQRITVQVTATGADRVLSFASGGLDSVTVPNGGWWRADFEYISAASTWLVT